MAETKRNRIKTKVAAAESRNQARAEAPALARRVGEKAVEAKDKFAAFAREHPIATVAGGIAVGVIVSSLFRGSPTRKAGRRLGQRAMGLAALGAELAVAYAQQAMEAANEARQSGAERLDGWSEDAVDYVAGARSSARNAGQAIAQAVRDRLN
jgi:hypothetical protein